jgi:hypothetical protein
MLVSFELLEQRLAHCLQDVQADEIAQFPAVPSDTGAPRDERRRPSHRWCRVHAISSNLITSGEKVPNPIFAGTGDPVRRQNRGDTAVAGRQQPAPGLSVRDGVRIPPAFYGCGDSHGIVRKECITWI